MFSSNSPHPPPLSPLATQLVNALATQNMLFCAWRNIFKTKVQWQAQPDQWCSNYVVWHSDEICFSTAPKELKLKMNGFARARYGTRAHDLTLSLPSRVFPAWCPDDHLVITRKQGIFWGLMTRDMSTIRKLWSKTFREQWNLVKPGTSEKNKLNF